MKLLPLASLSLGTVSGYRYDRGNAFSRQVRQNSLGIDMSKWVKSENGGYISGTCKCEIECTPDSIDETCGADVAIALDMSTCDQEKWERMTTFVDKLVSDLEAGQDLGGDRNTARVALTLFGAEPSEVIGFDSWNVDNADGPKADINEYFMETERNSQWTMYDGMGVDYEKIFNWADEKFSSPRSPGVDEELESLNFETTKMFVIVSDGHIQNSRNAQAMRDDLLLAKADLNGKIITVSQSGSNSAHCRSGGHVANCPNREFLGEIGDVYVDGGDMVDAAREVGNIIHQKKCIKHGECKPCNCECAFPRGPAGLEGPMGCDGTMGECGLAGTPGMDGLPGNHGEEGNEGVKGIKGDCGDPGFPGNPGPPGEPSPTGADADVGPCGLPGDRGGPGAPGDDGDKGFEGVAGPMGDPGPIGDNGAAGDPGPQGPAGGLILQNTGRSEVVTPDKLVEAIRSIVQEWMELDENQDVLECISDCDENERKAYVGMNCPDGSHFEPDRDGTKVGLPNAPPNSDGSGSCVRDPDVNACKEPLDIVFLVDGSDSIRRDHWPMVANWTNSLLDMVQPLERHKDTKVIYQQYSSASYLPDAIKQTITSFTNKDAAPALFSGLKAEIGNQLQQSQGTDTYHALNEIQKMFATELRSTADGVGKTGGSDGVTTILITLTDGAARDKAKNRKETVMREIKNRVDVMASVGVGTGVYKSELEDIATDSGHILMYDNYNRLTTFAHEIIELIGKDCKDMNANQGVSAMRRHIAPMERPLEEFNTHSSSAPDNDDDFLDFSSYWRSRRTDRRHRH